MKTSDKGLMEHAEREGIVLGPYRDSAGVWTWGIGHTVNAGKPDPRRMKRGMPEDIHGTIDAALDQFEIDLVKYENRVNDAIKVPLKQHEFDALVLFDFNTGGIYRATLTKRINAGDPDAADSFMGWSKPPEIIPRRRSTMELFKTGDYEANGDQIPVYSVSDRGKLGRIIKTYSGADLLWHIRGHRAEPIPIDATFIEPPAPPARTGWMAELVAAILAIFRRKT
ncbi:lysozyme [Profundibacter sp.]